MTDNDTVVAEADVDGGFDGASVEAAETLWACLPQVRKWTSLATHEKALVIHTLARHRHQSGRTGAGERETVARVIHQCLRPVNMANADWDSGAILGADNSWRRSVYSTADHILAALSQSTAGEERA